MMQRWTLVTGPAVEPVSIVTMREELRLAVADDDTWIQDAIQAAREALEESADLALITQTWDVFLDAFPAGPLWFHRGPIQSISSVNYTPNGEAEQTVTSSTYVLENADTRQKPSLQLAINASWPGDQLTAVNGVRIRLVAGYGSLVTDPPMRARRYIQQLVTHWYMHREPIVAGQRAEVPRTLDYLRRQLTLSGVG